MPQITFVIANREFDVYGTNGVVTVVGEARTRVGAKTVRRVVEMVGEARRAQPERFPGKIVVVVYCLRATPDAVEEARKLGVWLVESGREKTELRM